MPLVGIRGKVSFYIFFRAGLTNSESVYGFPTGKPSPYPKSSCYQGGGKPSPYPRRSTITIRVGYGLGLPLPWESWCKLCKLPDFMIQ